MAKKEPTPRAMGRPKNGTHKRPKHLERRIAALKRHNAKAKGLHLETGERLSTLVPEALEAGYTASELVKKTGISRVTIYKYIPDSLKVQKKVKKT